MVLSSLIAGHSSLRIQNFNNSEIDALNQNLSSVRNTVKQYIESRRIYIGLYADTHIPLLTSLLDEAITDNEITQVEQQIQQQVQAYIPEFLSFLIRTTSGRFIPDEFSEKVGEQCRNDIKQYSAKNNASLVSRKTNIVNHRPYLPIIHPSTYRYHIDMVSPWRDNKGDMHTLTVLLNPERLAEILKQLEIPGHRIVLLKQDSKTLIEITSLGDRSMLGENIHITDKEYNKLIGLRPIPNTLWDIAYVSNQSILDDNKKNTWVFTAAFMASDFHCISFLD